MHFQLLSEIRFFFSHFLQNAALPKGNMLQSELCRHVSEMRPSCFGENVKMIWTSERIWKRHLSFLAHGRRQFLLLLNWKAFTSCDKRSLQWLKGTLHTVSEHHSKLHLRNQKRPTSFCFLTEAADDRIFSGFTVLLLCLLFIYTQHPSFHLLSLHVSPALSFILPSSISLFLYSCVIPSIHSTLPCGVRGWLPVLTASYLTFSPLLWSNRRPTHTKSYRFTPPLADSSTSGRGWLHLQTSG